MAWTDVCKVNFKSACVGLTLKKRISVNAALKQFSKESGIPLRTLQRWWFEIKIEEEKSAKNGATTESAENYTNNDSVATRPVPTVWACRSCGRSDVGPALNGSSEPYSSKSKYFNICQPCKSQTAKAVFNGEGMQVVCPHCGGGHSIKWSTVESRLNTYNKTREEQNGKS